MKDYEENYWAKRVGQYNKTSWVKNEDFIDAFLGMLPRKSFDSILEVGIGTGAVEIFTTLPRGRLFNYFLIIQMHTKVASFLKIKV